MTDTIDVIAIRHPEANNRFRIGSYQALQILDRGDADHPSDLSPTYVPSSQADCGLWSGFGLLPLGPSGWKWIGGVAIVGAIALTCIPELVLGRYRRDEPDTA